MTKKGYKQTPEHRAKNSASHTGIPLSETHKAKIGASLKGKNVGPMSEAHKTNMITAVRAALNTPEVFQLIQQYGYSLINNLRVRYYSLNSRCNNPTDSDYKYYGGRDIQNLFTSSGDFVNHVMNDLGIIELSQIDGLQIDRINNNGNYKPGNIHFVTPKENSNNRR